MCWIGRLATLSFSPISTLVDAQHMILFDSFFFLVGVILKRVVLFQHIQHLHRGRQQHANAFPLYTPAHVCIVNNSPLQCTYVPGRDGGGSWSIDTHTHRESLYGNQMLHQLNTFETWMDGWENGQLPSSLMLLMGFPSFINVDGYIIADDISRLETDGRSSGATYYKNIYLYP